MRFELDEPVLRRLIANERLDPDWPVPAATDDDVRALHGRVFTALASAVVGVEEQLDDHGSGYASYKDGHVFPRGHELDRGPSGNVFRLHYVVSLSKLAPIAERTLGWSWRPEDQQRAVEQASHARWDRLPPPRMFPDQLVGPPDTVPWTDLITHIDSTLGRYGFHVLAEEELGLPLGFSAEIATILGEPPYTVRDAVFHWVD